MVTRTPQGWINKKLTRDGRRRPLKRELDDIDKTIDEITNF